MKTRSRKISKKIVSLVILILLMVAIVPAFAQENLADRQQHTDESNITINKTTEIRPDIGPHYANGVVKL